ncbi:transcription initiation factor TFIID subunit 4-like [Corvus cornix cornix]|uniref:transcription initiation factor TFIID subunit 4-like n=1 Tax=Corvus cornix cornix TaxID=932674 RepID=UPI00194EC7F0|nr:transcription initiation factor TFIID subunit 4-like [Corvus cornix cornix]
MEHKSSKESTVLSAFESVIQTAGANISDGDFSAQGRTQQWPCFPISDFLGEQILAVLHKILQRLDVQQEVLQQLAASGSPPETAAGPAELRAAPAVPAALLTAGPAAAPPELGPVESLAPGSSAELRAAPAVLGARQTAEPAGPQPGWAALPGPVEPPELGSSAEPGAGLEDSEPARGASAAVPAPAAPPPEVLAAAAPASAALAAVPASAAPPSAALAADVTTPPAGSELVRQSPGRSSSTPLENDARSVTMETPALRQDSGAALRCKQRSTRQVRNCPDCKILGYDGYLQDAFVLTCGTRSRTRNLQGNLQMMTRMQIIPTVKVTFLGGKNP